MKILPRACILFLVALTSVQFAYGANEIFNVFQNVTGDVTPPTVPANLTATSVAATQIDLSWDASTDDSVVQGYQVFRSDPGTTTNYTQIASSSLTTYSDTGLAASTTYYYFVTAFDPTPNISASSTVASSTTLGLPPTPVPEEGELQRGTRVSNLDLLSIEVIPEENAATVRYITKHHIKGTVRWGTTVSYELGSISGDSFSESHETRITGLEPGTKYYFTLEGETNRGKVGVITTDTFTTLPLHDVHPPANVSGLRAYIVGGDVVLDWQNPNDPDFAYVRVLRGNIFYPVDTQDGWFIYQGDSENARDDEAFSNGIIAYYSVFSYDALGNVSSGAVVFISKGGETPQTNDPVAPPSREGRAPEETSPLETDVEEQDAEESVRLLFDDLIFEQDGERLSSVDGDVYADGTKSITVKLPYESVPKHLKTIVIEVGEGSELESFLLRINDEGTFYETILAPFGVAEWFPVTVVVYDFETNDIGSVSGTIISTIAYLPDDEDREGFFAYLISFDWFRPWILLWVFFVFVLFFLLLWRRRDDEEKIQVLS